MPTALIVDDALLDRQIAQACVEALGWTALAASNGRDALQKIEQDRPHAVLTDLQMPEMSGLELVQQIRMRFPRLPVILMTAYGSEDIAVQALNAGAISYVPKKHLKQYLGDALRAVRTAVETVLQRDQVRHLLSFSETQFVLGYEPHGPTSLISYIQDGLERLNFCDESGLMRIGMALSESLTNAIEHGNLELDSSLRESEQEYRQQSEKRIKQPPYCDRRVYITVRLAQSEAMFAIRDDGHGFDPSTLPDPTDPENLLLPSGRGIMLVRTFMDEVHFNSQANEITMIKRRAPEGV